MTNAVRTLVLGVAMSLVAVAYAWLGARLRAMDTVPGLWLGVGLLAVWGVTGAVAVVLTRSVRHGLLDMLRALEMNLVLGLAVGGLGAWAVAKWQRRT